VKYGICFIIKIFLAPLAIEFRVRTVTSIFLYILRILVGDYILRMPTHTYNMIIPCTSDFLKLEDRRSSGRNKSALSLAQTF
jgi:hypothetical protein